MPAHVSPDGYMSAARKLRPLLQSDVLLYDEICEYPQGPTADVAAEADSFENFIDRTHNP